MVDAALSGLDHLDIGFDLSWEAAEVDHHIPLSGVRSDDAYRRPLGVSSVIVERIARTVLMKVQVIHQHHIGFASSKVDLDDVTPLR
jgi:hypothetical protein